MENILIGIRQLSIFNFIIFIYLDIEGNENRLISEKIKIYYYLYLSLLYIYSYEDKLLLFCYF